MIYKLFTTPSCPGCVAAKELLKNSGLKIETIEVIGNVNLEVAREYDVAMVPSLIEIDEKNPKKILGRYGKYEGIKAFLQNR